MIDSALAAFLQQGLAMHIGARDARLEPEGARVLAARVEPDGRHLVVYVADVAAVRILPLLEQNGQAAVTFARPVDDRACQVKGIFVDARAAADEEREIVTAQWEGLLDQLRRIGICRDTVAAWTTWPVTAIRLKVNAIFDQTPGAAAGAVIA